MDVPLEENKLIRSNLEELRINFIAAYKQWRRAAEREGASFNEVFATWNIYCATRDAYVDFDQARLSPLYF